MLNLSFYPFLHPTPVYTMRYETCFPITWHKWILTVVQIAESCLAENVWGKGAIDQDWGYSTSLCSCQGPYTEGWRLWAVSSNSVDFIGFSYVVVCWWLLPIVNIMLALHGGRVQICFISYDVSSWMQFTSPVQCYYYIATSDLLVMTPKTGVLFKWPSCMHSLVAVCWNTAVDARERKDRSS